VEENRLLVSEDNVDTVGWFCMGTGTVGITKGQTLRLSTVNVGSRDVSVLAGVQLNPNPVHEESFSLRPGESKHYDLDAAGLDTMLFDSRGRVQIRAFVRSNAPTARVNVEVFDSQTGRTSIILPLQQFARLE
jgi:hypothetical protein